MVGVRTRGPAWALGGAYSPHHSSLLDVLGSEPGGPPLDGPALSVALDVVQAWAVLITVGFTLVLFVFLAFCVCARKDDGYDEYELSQGLTTVKVCHDGGENGLSSYPRINGSNTPKGSDEASEASSRCTLKRELPAIPLSAHPDPSAECNVERTQSQHSSDLYAAVGDVNDASGIAKVIGGVQVLPSGAIGPGGRAAILRDPNVTSPTDSSGPTTSDGPGVATSVAAAHPYAKVKKEHPYAHVKLPKKDHPYAKVVRDDSEDPETDTDNYDDPKAIAKDKNSGWDSEATYEAAPPVPEKRFDLEEETAVGSGPPADSIVGGGGLMTTSVTSASSALGPSSPRSPLLSARVSMTSSAHSPTSPHSTGPSADRPPSADIPAAMAISGRTPANEELPYMTPPLHHAGIELPVQQNFSGDSQDSRGYTSISVREPLAALKAQSQGTAATTASPATQPHEGEGYYMTVSDDSADEMYACIYEGSRGVGSETYAQIEPRSTPPPPPPPMPSPPHAPSTPSPLSTRGGSQPPPAPPSVDSLRHVVHSRQASSSSAASTVMGSPGAEKRGTRSPLPPLPQGDTSLYSGPSPQPPHSPPRAAAPPAERPTQRALEEMYAKYDERPRKHTGVFRLLIDSDLLTSPSSQKSTTSRPSARRSSALETSESRATLELMKESPVVPVLTSVAQSFPTPIKSPEASLSDDDVVLGMAPDKKSVAFDDSPDKTFSPSSDSSDEESLSEKFPQQKPPPRLESPVKEQSSLEKEGPVQHPSSQSPTKVTDPSAQESHVEAVSLLSEDVNENASVTSGDSEKFPAPPQVSSPDRTSTAAFDSLGTQDGVPVSETHNQPQETINPLYMVGDSSNQQQSMMQETSAMSQVVSVGLCGDLPPPPPVEEDEAAFPNDLPPPLPEVTSFMPSNDALAEEAPPPPLVSPSDVEGLEDMLPLAHMGSSSSGSTAGQPGSIHGSSEKDSDSPQESEDTQMEGTIVADDLPPPPMATTTGSEQDSDEELDNSVSSGYEHGFTAGGITVTVNPMADMEDTQEATDSLPPPPPSEPSPVAPPSPIAVSAVVTSSAGSQSSSNGSGSQDTGSGSVESVVTVECAVAGDPRVQDRQRSTDSSSKP
ncbi:flocculation protein FLO11-like [Penaeus monodon]|uniref:flocculation protein FLO11-like n=1 Tax=Penaeus monodon TaxID=6687 RepID=UPI0018A6E8B1|nr:flocculation protein FLO11-like [Penaeus monodon]